MKRGIVFVVLFAGLLLGPIAAAQPTSTGPLNDEERLELQLFRLKAQQDRTPPQPADPAYIDFRKRSYEQVSEMYELGLRALKWQLMASDVLLVLVVVVTASGVALSAYQLWIAGRLALSDTKASRERDPEASIASSTLEISAGRIRVQTAFVGIMVLAISAALLLLFVREVYTIHLSSPPVVAEGSARAN